MELEILDIRDEDRHEEQRQDPRSARDRTDDNPPPPNRRRQRANPNSFWRRIKAPTPKVNNPSDMKDKNLVERVEELKQMSNIRAYLLNEEIAQKTKKIHKLTEQANKTREEEEYIIRLRKEVEEIRKEQEQHKIMQERMTVCQELFKGYMTHKLEILLTETMLIADGTADIAKSIRPEILHNLRGYEVIAKKSEEELQKSAQDGTLRAELIRAAMDTCAALNDKALELGVVKKDDPLLTTEDTKRLWDLAKIAEDIKNPDRAKLYAEKCAEFGMSKEKALKSIEADKSFSMQRAKIVKDVIMDKAKEITHTLSR